MPYNRDELGYQTTALRGAAALSDLLDCVGTGGDHNVAKILVENEMQLRALLTFSLDEFARRI